MENPARTDPPRRRTLTHPKQNKIDPLGQNKIDPCQTSRLAGVLRISLQSVSSGEANLNNKNMSIKIKNILRCYAIGTGIREMSVMFHLSRNTVRSYVRKFQDSGIKQDVLLGMSESHLQEMFGSGGERNREPSTRMVELEALLPDYAARLNSDKHLTKKLLYEEYRREHPDGFKDSCFKLYLRQYMTRTKAVGHVDHHAGDQMYVDYAGDKLEVTDVVTGEVKSVEVFVAILPCSHYTYCEASWSQKKEDFIVSCENALHFFGGVPLAIVPDNLKSAVTRHGRHESVINEDFAAFAEHYDMAVYPTRVRHPKDKALVENAVKLMYRTVYKDIEGLVFHDLKTLNDAILVSLDKYNAMRMAGRDYSRVEHFSKSEKDYLRPLPSTLFCMKERKSVTVQKNGYITLMKHHYSVPVEYIGKRVEVVYDSNALEIYHNMRLITTHLRDDTPFEYTQKDTHGLPGRHGSYENDLQDIYHRAGEIDNILLDYLKEVEREKKYPPLAFIACRGIMSLEKKYGQGRLVAACACAHEKRAYGYGELKNILENGDDADFMPGMEDNGGTSEVLMPRVVNHQNIRGKEYFSKKQNEDTNQ